MDPEDPDHIVAGSNDYFYRFNNSTGARQAIVPTGFFTSFDGGETWIDGRHEQHDGKGEQPANGASTHRHGLHLTLSEAETALARSEKVDLLHLHAARSTTSIA